LLKKKKKEELKWYPALDKVLLTDCLEKEVWTATRNTRVQMFTAVANSLRTFDGSKFKLATGRNCQARYGLLMERFVSDNFANMNTSGSTEEYEDREQLLQQIKDCTARYKEELLNASATKQSADKDLIAHGKLLREASMSRMSSQKTTVTQEPDNPLMMMAHAFKDMIEMSKPPAPVNQPPAPPELLSFKEAQIRTVWDYLFFAGIPEKWHEEYLKVLENFGFDTAAALHTATGQQLVAAGLKMGHVNLLLVAKTKLKN
jgi:hypothetical protein